jgi:mono/diheme cytochrome c family protein
LVAIAIASLMLPCVAAAVTPASNASADVVAKGKYLAAAGDCVACHTPPGGKPLAGGLVMQTPFGPITTPNITRDAQTGIGNWSDEDFYRLMHEGIGKEGEYIYPVMPFPWYTIVSRDDVLAIKAYIFSMPAVHNPRPPNTLTFPFNIRSSLLAWREAFFTPGKFTPNPGQSEAVNRGAYLVKGLAHCGECHNARPVAGASRWRGSLAGGTVENWYAPNISSDPQDGIGDWKNSDIALFLKIGTAPGRGVAVGPMAETIHSLSQLTDADRDAIAAYLKTTPPTSASKGQSDPASLYASGAQTYLDYCASCHGVKGEGVPHRIPALDGSGVVTAQGPQNVISVVLGGLPSTGTYAPMLAVGAAMRDEEIADVANYVRKSWGNAAPATATPHMVGDLRKQIDTVMTGAALTKCPSIGSPALARALSTPQVTAKLFEMSGATMYQSATALAAKVKRAVPSASATELVNGFAAAYCSVVRKDEALDLRAKSLKIGHFVEYVYMAGAQSQH